MPYITGDEYIISSFYYDVYNVHFTDDIFSIQDVKQVIQENNSSAFITLEYLLKRSYPNMENWHGEPLYCGLVYVIWVFLQKVYENCDDLCQTYITPEEYEAHLANYWPLPPKIEAVESILVFEFRCICSEEKVFEERPYIISKDSKCFESSATQDSSSFEDDDDVPF